MSRATVVALLVGLAAATPDLSAQTLARSVLPDHYTLQLTLDPRRDTFAGDETILVNIIEPTSRITLNAVGIRFDEVTVVATGGTQTAAVTQDDESETATLTVRRRLGPGLARIHILYTAHVNTELRGVYGGRANDRRYLATQLEATDARRAFPAFDQPDMKASFSMSVVVPVGDVAISNGQVLSDVPGPEPGQHTIRFSTTRKMSTYLVAIAVGDFACIETKIETPAPDGARPSDRRTIGRPDAPIPLRACAIRGREGFLRFAVDAAQAVFRYYSGYFTTRYPFGKLDLVAVPEFEGGGMENTAAIFFAERDLLVDQRHAPLASLKNVAETVSHEVAHQWLGDLVTMQWWNDLWLKEGLATWIETKPLASWKPEWHMDLDEVMAAEEAMAVDGLPASQPIRRRLTTPDEIETAYDAITYQKAGAVMRMIEATVGPDTFRAAINDYLRRFAYANATAEDFRQVLSEHSTRPTDAIVRTFLEQAGVPAVSMSARCDTGATSTLGLSQQRFWIDPKQGAPSPSWTIPVSVRSIGIQDNATVPEKGTSAATWVSTPKLLAERDQQFDLAGCARTIFGNADAVGYFRVTYSSEDLKRLADLRASLTWAERLRLLNDQWAFTQAGRVDAGTFLSLVATYTSDRQPQTLGKLSSILSAVDAELVAEADRDTFRAWVRQFMKSVAVDSPEDDDMTRRARNAIVVSALGTLGGDADVQAQARLSLLAEPSGQAMDASLAGAYASIAAASGDGTVLERLVTRAQQAATPEGRQPFVEALGHFTDPALLVRALDYALDNLPAPEVTSVATAALENRLGGSVAWPFVKSHWDGLAKKAGISGEAELIAAAGGLCDATLRGDVTDFFTSKGFTVKGQLAQTLQRIDACVGFKAAQQQSAHRWIADQTRPR